MAMPTVTIAITLPDGDVAIMQFIVEGRGDALPRGASWVTAGRWSRAATTDNVDAEVRKTFEGQEKKPTSWRVIPQALVPTDRTYRGAWTDIGGVIAHNMTKARDIHRDRIRSARTARFAALDAAYIRADESGDTTEKKRIAQIKTRLRDAPADPAIDTAQTIEQLKAFWPADLI